MAARGAEPDGGEPLVLLVLSVGGRELAVPAEAVVEVARPGTVTPLAGAPPWVRGVAAVRGAILPVVDLGARWRGAADRGGGVDPASDRWVVVVADGRRRAALAGAVVRAVATAAEPARPGQPAAGSPEGAGALPWRGTVRPRREGGADGAADALPLLDVRALLDELLEERSESAGDGLSPGGREGAPNHD